MSRTRGRGIGWALTYSSRPILLCTRCRTLAVGVSDVRSVCEHSIDGCGGGGATPCSVLWPLAVIVWSDLARALPSWMAIKEMVIVVPRVHARRKYVTGGMDERMAGWLTGGPGACRLTRRQGQPVRADGVSGRCAHGEPAADRAPHVPDLCQEGAHLVNE